jgi:hypothetical protein
MAQWIPKTQWRLSNLNKLYGLSEIGLHNAGKASGFRPGPQRDGPFMGMPYRPVPAVRKQAAGQTEAPSAFDEQREMLQRAYDAEVPFVDIRDEYEVSRSPLRKALVFHHHDLLSGACNDILPPARKEAHLVLVASTEQRAVNGFKALRRWGFRNVVVVVDSEAIAGLDREESKAAEKKQQ